MENTIYIALSKQNVLENNMDIIANNIANMNTPGFRAQNIIFEEYLTEGGEDRTDNISMVNDPAQYEVTAPGPMRQTGNPFDIALEGPGFLEVTGFDGAPAYTRAGDLQIRADGELVTSTGALVGISIPDDGGAISIDERGFVSNNNGQIGQIKVVEFENIQTLEAMGNNLYRTDAAPTKAQKTRVAQGMLEGSNVNGVLEMTRMIDVSRKYQSLSRMIDTENDRIRGAIQALVGNS